MAERIKLRQSERQEIYNSLHALAMGEARPYMPSKVPSFYKRAKELSDQLWDPPGNWQPTEVVCDNFDLWVLYNAAVASPRPLHRICEEAISRFEEPHELKGDPYNSTKWRQNRKIALQQAGDRCQQCGMSNSEHREEWDVGLHVHHKKPIRGFDKISDAHELENLEALCASCHGEEHTHRPI